MLRLLQSLREAAERHSSQFDFSFTHSSLAKMIAILICAFLLITIPAMFVVDVPCLASFSCNPKQPDPTPEGEDHNVRVMRGAPVNPGSSTVDPGDRSGVHGHKVNVSICKPSCSTEITYLYPRSNFRKRMKHGEAFQCAYGYQPSPSTINCHSGLPTVVCRLKPGHCVVSRQVSCGVTTQALMHGSPFPRCMGRLGEHETVDCSHGNIIHTTCLEEDLDSCCEMEMVLKSNATDSLSQGVVRVGEKGACHPDYDLVSLQYEGTAECQGFSRQQMEDVKCHCSSLRLKMVCQLKEEFC